jgi:Ni,Fe-hydrogenase I small subunit
MAEPTTAPYGRKTQREPAVKEVHVLWTPDGLGCDGDTISTTAASQPSIEDIVMGAIPGLPKVHLHNRVLAYSLGGDEYLKVWHDAAEGRLDAPFILVVEGSIPNEDIKAEGYWAAMGNDPQTGQPITLCEWIDRLAPKAFAVVAAGTCATYGGIHAMAGGCPNVGGICIACTMPGFPDKFMPFMDEPPGGILSAGLISMYGRVIRNLRAITNNTVNKEPKWRHRGRQLTTGYHPTTY